MSTIRDAGANAVRHIAVALAVALPVMAFAPVTVRAQQGNGPSEDLAAWVAPERASKRTSPTPASVSTVKKGRELFVRDCLKCHGKGGQGDGPQAPFLEMRPRDLTSATVAAQTDGALFWKMSEGFGPMPKSSMSEPEKWAVIDYIRTLSKK